MTPLERAEKTWKEIYSVHGWTDEKMISLIAAQIEEVEREANADCPFCESKYELAYKKAKPLETFLAKCITDMKIDWGEADRMLAQYRKEMEFQK